MTIFINDNDVNKAFLDELEAYFSTLSTQLLDTGVRQQFEDGTRDPEVYLTFSDFTERVASKMLEKNKIRESQTIEETVGIATIELGFYMDLYYRLFDSMINLASIKRSDLVSGQDWDTLIGEIQEQFLDLESSGTLFEVRGLITRRLEYFENKPAFRAAFNSLLLQEPTDQGVFDVSKSKSVSFLQNNDILAKIKTGITPTSVQLSGLPDGLQIDGVDGTITVSDQASLVPGNYTIHVETQDDQGGISVSSFNLDLLPDEQAVYTVAAPRIVDSYLDNDVLATVSDPASTIKKAVLNGSELPDGFALNAVNGEITVSNKLLLVPGTFQLNIQTTNTEEYVVDHVVAIVIDEDSEAVYDVIKSRSIDLISTGDIMATVTDADGDIISSTVTGLPPGVAMDSSGNITVSDINSVEPGRYNFNVTVLDDQGNTTINSLTIVIEDPDRSFYYLSAAPDKLHNYTDSQSLATVQNVQSNLASADLIDVELPAGMALNNTTGEITVSDHTLLVAGTYALNILLTDTSGFFARYVADIKIEPSYSAFYTLAPRKDIAAYQAGDSLAVATDPDGAIQTAVLVEGSLPGGVVLNATTGELTVSDPGLLVSGVYNFKVKTTDEYNGETTNRVSLFFFEGNGVSYVYEPVKNAVAYNNEDVIAYVQNSGDEIVSARISKGSLPPGIGLNVETGELFVEDNSLLYGGTFTGLVIILTDTRNAETTHQISIEIGVDLPAVYTLTTPKDINTYTSSETLASVSDPDGNVVSTQLISGQLPYGVTMNTETGEIAVLPDSPAPTLIEGVYPLSVITTDELGGTTTHSFTLRLGLNTSTIALPWDPEKDYKAGEYVERLGKIYKAVQDNKAFDPAVDESSINWSIVDTAITNFGKIWVPGNYLQNQVVTKLSTHELFVLVADTSGAPYASSDLDAEITAGDWENFNNQSLAQTLLKGNTTGGTNPRISTGDKIEFGNTLALSGHEIWGEEGGDMFIATAGDLEVSSSFASFQGITYDADYSANFTNHSLVDKAYVSGKYPTTTEDSNCSYDYAITTGTPTLDDMTGATTVSLGDDDVSSPIALGSSFFFFGKYYDNFYIHSNGYISFGGTELWKPDEAIPNTNSPNDAIYGWALDLSPNSGGTVQYKEFGASTVVVEFSSVPTYDEAIPTSFRIKIQSSGVITIQTISCDTPTGSPVVQGIEDASGKVAFAVSGRNFEEVAGPVTNEEHVFTPSIAQVEVLTQGGLRITDCTGEDHLFKSDDTGRLISFDSIELPVVSKIGTNKIYKFLEVPDLNSSPFTADAVLNSSGVLSYTNSDDGKHGLVVGDIVRITGTGMPDVDGYRVVIASGYGDPFSVQTEYSGTSVIEFTTAPTTSKVIFGEVLSVSTCSVSSNFGTIVTNSSHNLSTGDWVQIAQSQPMFVFPGTLNELNGYYQVSVVDSTTFDIYTTADDGNWQIGSLTVFSGEGIKGVVEYDSDPSLMPNWSDRSIPDRAYVDGKFNTVASGIDNKDFVATSTEGLGNITLSGEQTLNGVTTSSSRVLVMEQTSASTNGIYVTAAGAWSRSTDADSDDEVTNGVTVYVNDSNSTVYRNKYLLTTPDPITVGTTDLTFSVLPALDLGTTAGTALEGNSGLDTILTNGNTTGANNLIIDSGQVILSGSGDGQINLREGSDGIVTITSDNGGWTESAVSVTPDALWLQASASLGRIYQSGTNEVSMSTGDAAILLLKDNGGSGAGTPINFPGIVVEGSGTTNSTVGSVVTSAAVHINTSNSTYNTGVLNSAIIGGESIIANKNSYAFVENLEVQNGIAQYSYDPTIHGDWGPRSIPDKAYVDAQVAGTDTLSEVLANGNTTGTNNIVINDGQKITCTNEAWIEFKDVSKGIWYNSAVDQLVIYNDTTGSGINITTGTDGDLDLATGGTGVINLFTSTTARYGSIPTLTDDKDVVHKKYVDDLVGEVAFTQTGQTTSASQLTLTSPKAVATSSVLSFKIKVTAIQSGQESTEDGTIGDVWVHEFIGAVKNIGGTTSIVGEVTEITIAEDTGTSAFSVSVEANDTTDVLDIKVTGETGKQVEWKAIADFDEITY